MEQVAKKWLSGGSFHAQRQRLDSEGLCYVSRRTRPNNFVEQLDGTYEAYMTESLDPSRNAIVGSDKLPVRDKRAMSNIDPKLRALMRTKILEGKGQEVGTRSLSPHPFRTSVDPMFLVQYPSIYQGKEGACGFVAFFNFLIVAATRYPSLGNLLTPLGIDYIDRGRKWHLAFGNRGPGPCFGSDPALSLGAVMDQLIQSGFLRSDAEKYLEYIPIHGIDEKCLNTMVLYGMTGSELTKNRMYDVAYERSVDATRNFLETKLRSAPIELNMRGLGAGGGHSRCCVGYSETDFLFIDSWDENVRRGNRYAQMGNPGVSNRNEFAAGLSWMDKNHVASHVTGIIAPAGIDVPTFPLSSTEPPGKRRRQY